MLKLQPQKQRLQRRTLPVCLGPAESDLLRLGLNSEGTTGVATGV